MNRIRSKKNDIIVFKLKSDLFCIGQRLNDQIMRFFDIFSSDESAFEGLDLNNCNKLFDVMVSTVYIEKKYAINKVKNSIPSSEPYTRFWISSHDIFSPYFKKGNHSYGIGGKLIDLGNNNFSIWDSPVIKDNLSVEKDREIIENYELVNMWGEDLIERLIRYYETGINRDDLKFELFPTLWNDREQLRPLTSRLPEPFR